MADLSGYVPESNQERERRLAIERAQAELAKDRETQTPPAPKENR